MIIGLGSDLIDIRRIEQTLERFGPRFVGRVFTEVERTKSDRRADRAASYAKRFAAKEACSKALGTGLRRGASGEQHLRRLRCLLRKSLDQMANTANRSPVNARGHRFDRVGTQRRRGLAERLHVEQRQ